MNTAAGMPSAGPVLSEFSQSAHLHVRTSPAARIQLVRAAGPLIDNRQESIRAMPQWVEACGTDDVEQEEVIRFDHQGRTFCIFRSPEDDFYCTDGLCTHEKVHLADGLVMDHSIECPKHNGVFDYRTGEAMRMPVCINLKTFAVRVENDRVFIEI